MTNPCSPIIEAGSALARTHHHAAVHHAHAGVGHAGAPLHAPTLHAPLYGPPAPQTAALCSKVPGGALAAGPGAPATSAAAANGAAAAPSALTAAQSAAPSAAGLGAPGIAGLSSFPGAGSTLGATKAAILATALLAGLGTAVAFTPTQQPTPGPLQLTPEFAQAPVIELGSPFDQIPEGPQLNFGSAPPASPDITTTNTPPLAVPEPASLVTLGLGAALAALARRRLRRP